MEGEKWHNGGRKHKMKQFLAVAGAVKEIIHDRTSLFTHHLDIHVLHTYTHIYG